jgi:hypothetical protein
MHCVYNYVIFHFIFWKRREKEKNMDGTQLIFNSRRSMKHVHVVPVPTSLASTTRFEHENGQPSVFRKTVRESVWNKQKKTARKKVRKINLIESGSIWKNMANWQYPKADEHVKTTWEIENREGRELSPVALPNKEKWGQRVFKLNCWKKSLA